MANRSRAAHQRRFAKHHPHAARRRLLAKGSAAAFGLTLLPLMRDAAAAAGTKEADGSLAASRWATAAPLPIATQELYPTVHQGSLVVAGGIARLGVPYFTDRAFAYDPSADRWQDLPRLPQPIHHAALISTGERLLLFGGFHGGYSHVWRMRDAIHELTPSGWKAIGKLPAPQAEGVLSQAPDGAVHLVSGQQPKGQGNRARSDHQEVDSHWRWDPNSERFEALAPIPTPRNSATGGWLGSRLIVTGGRTAAGNLDVTESYDAKRDRWERLAPLPRPQAGTGGAVHEGQLYVLGGEIFQPRPAVFANSWRFDGNRWEALPDLKTPRHGLGTAVLGNRLFAVGGATAPSGSGTSAANEYLTLKA